MERMTVTTPTELPDEQRADSALRPAQLEEFVGQDQVKT